YNKQLMKQAGVTSVPTSLEDAWTWKQFDAVLASMRKALPSDKYPLVVNWQGNGVTRWLSWLFEANGRFLSPDGTSSPIDSAAGRAAVDYTRAFFTEKYVPPNSSVKSTSLAQDIWFSQTAAMAFEGGFLLPDAKTTATFDWGATYPPRDHRAASDFGGNAVVVTSQTKKAEQAVAFLDYLTDAGVMKDFCARASLLPTRRDLVSSGIRYDVRGDLTKVFIDQASTVRPQDAAQVASPSMLKIITVLQDQLENAFVGGQSTQRTLSALAGGIESAVGK
ncbi:extracellular solute-binding protein, partial [Jatrophihabitans endophyticus]|uniref:extracellular solute-binding protein n=1 Tax=Jatrophihabitans endophyticus TaxID=1206085 RepID=UPI0019E93D81